jgi:hypothetical protein
MTCVGALENTQIFPEPSMGARTLLATVCPATKFTFEAFGLANPQGQTVR